MMGSYAPENDFSRIVSVARFLDTGMMVRRNASHAQAFWFQLPGFLILE